jgi:outer membrane protein assembly factor BamB
MLDNKLKIPIIIVVILFIFIGSIVTPITFGQFNSLQEKNMTREYLDPNFYNCYHQSESLPYSAPTQSTNSFHSQIIGQLKKEISSPATADGPMDSPWPMYCHDPHHSGRSPYNTINTSGVQKWNFKTNKVGLYGSTVVDSEGIIYYTAEDLYAIYPNGTLKWQFKTNGWSESCPAIDENGIIYTGTSIGDPNYFYAIYPNGTLKWRYWLSTEMLSSPVIGVDGTIIFGCGNNIFALYPNGTKRWQYTTGHVVYSSPAISDDGTVYCGSHDTYLYALYPNNGTVKWKFHTGDWIRVSPCIADDGTIYCVSLDDYLYAIYPNGTMKWKTSVGGGTSPTIGQDGTIYAGYSYLCAVNPTNGSIKWIFPSAGDIEGGTPCNSKEDIIYFGSYNGYCIAINPNGTEVWRAPIGECESAPAIGEDGTIYIGGSDNDGRGILYALGSGPLKAEANGPYNGYAFVPLEFTGTAEGGILPYIYHWDFGDGQTSDLKNPTHNYTNIGNYTVTFIVSDNTGNTSRDTANVTITYAPPTITILKPENALYLFNIKTIPFPHPHIIGPITIRVNATEAPLGIDLVEFYIDDHLKATDSKNPYQWTWIAPAFFKHTIKVIAYDTSGKNTTISLGVSKFF